MDECKIPYNVTKDSLHITSSDGTSVLANFDPYRVMSTDMNVAMAEFHGVTNAAGYGEPQPVDRGATPTKKRIFKDSLLARWRHSEMRTVPNLPAELVEKFEPIAVREANTFYGRNRFICSLMGYDIDIARNDARIWTNTFLGRYRLRYEDAEQEDTENRKLLTNYLRQRFVEQRKGMDRERRNVEPGEAYGSYIEEHGEEPTEEWRKAHDEIGVKSPASRKAKVKDILNANFAKMGHNGMLETLRFTAKEHPCVDTRQAASRYLKKHLEGCLECVAAAQVEQQVASGKLASA